MDKLAAYELLLAEHPLWTKEAKLSRALKPFANAEGYTTAVRQGGILTPMGEALSDPRIRNKLYQHHEGKSRAVRIAKARSQGGVRGKAKEAVEKGVQKMVTALGRRIPR